MTDPFALEEPAFASRLWIYDGIHCPRALPPLSGDIWSFIGSTEALGMDSMSVRGFTYMSPRSMTPPATMEPLGGGEARRRWEEHHRPLCIRTYDALRALPLKGSIGELAKQATDALPFAAEAFEATLVSAAELGPDAERLSGFLEARLGAEGGLAAAVILHGAETETASLGRDVARLAEQARQTPSVLPLLQTRQFEQAMASIDEPWASELRDFLLEHQDEVASWSEIHQPPWDADPLPLMRLVASSLRARAVGDDRAAEATEQTRAQLSPEDLPDFESALALSRDYVPIIEERARYQLKLMGALRRPFAALGEALAQANVVSKPEDVFFLSLEEIRGLGNSPPPLQAVVAERRAAWQENLGLTPPNVIGLPVPWEMIGTMSPMARRMFGAVAIAAPTESVVSGIGANPGTWTGRARVVLGLEDADNIEDGDILVCPSTSPPWTPYFAVVGAIVTNSGGVLSHAAIAAREYGIPAVVGTQRGTTLIPDGATVTVDGAAGTVTVVSVAAG